MSQITIIAQPNPDRKSFKSSHSPTHSLFIITIMLEYPKHLFENFLYLTATITWILINVG